MDQINELIRKEMFSKQEIEKAKLERVLENICRNYNISPSNIFASDLRIMIEDIGGEKIVRVLKIEHSFKV